MTIVAFWKSHSGCRVEDALGEDKPGGRETQWEAEKQVILTRSSTVAGPVSHQKADEGWIPAVLLRGLVCMGFQACTRI